MRHHQQGFSLVTAIFLIVILAALGSWLITISAVNQQTPVLGMRGAKAYHAARSGLEWGMGHVINNAPPCPGNQNFPNLEGFAVAVSWTCSTHSDGSPPTNVTIYVIETTAEDGVPGTAGYAFRMLRGIASPSGPL